LLAHVFKACFYELGDLLGFPGDSANIFFGVKAQQLSQVHVFQSVFGFLWPRSSTMYGKSLVLSRIVGRANTNIEKRLNFSWNPFKIISGHWASRRKSHRNEALEHMAEETSTNLS
jgi:hypothetical protein